MGMTLAGCAAPTRVTPVHQRQATFVQDEYEQYSRPGASSIAGQAFLKTQGGDVKFGAGNDVILAPATSYSKEWFEVRVLRDRAISPPEPRAERFNRSTLADGTGRFRFESLPAGAYYVACYISWMVPGLEGLQKTGGWAFALAHVDSGVSSEIVVTRPDLGTQNRLRTKSGAQSPVDAPFTVKLELGESLGVTEMQVDTELLRVVLPNGETRYLNPAHVVGIVDAAGTDWTKAVLDQGKHLIAE